MGVVGIMKELYFTFMIMVYSINFFAGSLTFFICCGLKFNDNITLSLCAISCLISLYIYLFEIDKYCIDIAEKSIKFNILMWISLLLPFIVFALKN